LANRQRLRVDVVYEAGEGAGDDRLLQPDHAQLLVFDGSAE
jgi:hypothetical protein